MTTKPRVAKTNAPTHLHQVPSERFRNCHDETHIGGKLAAGFEQANSAVDSHDTNDVVVAIHQHKLQKTLVTPLLGLELATSGEPRLHRKTCVRLEERIFNGIDILAKYVIKCFAEVLRDDGVRVKAKIHALLMHKHQGVTILVVISRGLLKITSIQKTVFTWCLTSAA